MLAGKSKAEIVAATTAAFDKGELPALEPGSMCYMMSKQQYLNDAGKSWHPHLMFFVAGDAEKSWGANVDGSPIIAANDPGGTRDDHDGAGGYMVGWDAGARDGAVMEFESLLKEFRDGCLGQLLNTASY